MRRNEIKLAKELQEEFESLTEFEALNIACRICNNEALEVAFGVNGFSATSPPAFLEAIGMALGYDRTRGSLKENLGDIAESLGEIASALRETNS